MDPDSSGRRRWTDLRPEAAAAVPDATSLEAAAPRPSLLARLGNLLQRRAAASAAARNAGSFGLLRYFTVTSLIAFSVVAVALYVLEGMEESFFAKVQSEQGSFFAQMQDEMARQYAASAQDNLLAVHEVGHVNLTRLFANVLWESDFGPFVARVRQLPLAPCRVAGLAAEQRHRCTADLGRQIRALPGFAALDARAYTMMKKTTAFKIKVFDLRGLTVYSSEHAQIGEDKADNKGWVSAVGGRPASELTHRDRFSAFEGVVENRDLISSYLPVWGADGRIVGVFEIYSDVTPLLEQIKGAAARMEALALADRTRVEIAAKVNQGKVAKSSDRLLAIVAALLALLYFALLMLVSSAQRTMDAQALIQQRAQQREEHWHREKMSVLATMAANVAHEVGNPLATIAGVAQEIAAHRESGGCGVCQPQLILEQTQRIQRMVRQIADFAAARGETLQLGDVNQMVKAVCDFLGFDRRFRSRPIVFRPDEHVPARVVIPDHLNEVLMNLLQACSEGDAAAGGKSSPLHVATRTRGDDVLIRIGGEAPGEVVESRPGLEQDPRIEAARRRIVGMGGRLEMQGTSIEITLPPLPAELAVG